MTPSDAPFRRKRSLVPVLSPPSIQEAPCLVHPVVSEDGFVAACQRGCSFSNTIIRQSAHVYGENMHAYPSNVSAPLYKCTLSMAAHTITPAYKSHGGGGRVWSKICVCRCTSVHETDRNWLINVTNKSCISDQTRRHDTADSRISFDPHLSSIFPPKPQLPSWNIDQVKGQCDQTCSRWDPTKQFDCMHDRAEPFSSVSPTTTEPYQHIYSKCRRGLWYMWPRECRVNPFSVNTLFHGPELRWTRSSFFQKHNITAQEAISSPEQNV